MASGTTNSKEKCEGGEMSPDGGITGLLLGPMEEPRGQIARWSSPDSVDDAMGRLFWSASGSLWCVPMVFVLEDSTVLPPAFQRWDARATSSYLGLRYRVVTEWMVSILEGRHHGFRVPWDV
ncbi:hypothetical protein GOP47_0017544 [Adiantum capillus-veneris]|uniref:Uncharacterized protein n=1 Tax=Adiantum capillus-veneris TaxID=13818 RepID=A0A9D4ZBV9_ADICA|nr:hypothetical protein GOP47_0017544 [Adiantum capillus-veneris]